jgi:drug/metabolite transporter (DMT)-like permease
MSRADLALLLICAVWGTTFALLRDALHKVSPAELVAYRFTLAALFLLVVNARRLRSIRMEWVKDGAWIGVWLAAGYLTQVMGLRSISASRSAFITSMSIAIVPFIAFLMLRARPVLGESVGVILAVAGLVLFSADAGFSLRAGELWTLACAAAFAVQIVVTHIVGQRSPTLPLSLFQTVVGAAAGWTFVLLGGGPSTPAREIPWGVLLYLSLIATAGVILLQTWALARTSSVKAGVLYATEPIFAAIFAVSFFGEHMTPRELVGAGLILAGVVVSELWRPWIRSRGNRSSRIQNRDVSAEALPPSDPRGASGPG